MTGGLDELDAVLEGEKFKTLERLEFTLKKCFHHSNHNLGHVVVAVVVVDRGVRRH